MRCLVEEDHVGSEHELAFLSVGIVAKSIEGVFISDLGPEDND